MLRQPRRVFAGAITPSGQAAFIRALQLSLSGAISPAGTVTRSTVKLLAGVLITAGVLLRRPIRQFGGLLDLAGTLTLPDSLPPVAVWWPMLYMSARAPVLRFSAAAQALTAKATPMMKRMNAGARSLTMKAAARMIRIKK